MSETQWTPQISYYLAQIKDLKPDMKVYVIDARFSQTAVLMESHPKFKYIGIANGTDAALIMGMVHHILKDNECYNALKSLYGASNETELVTAVNKSLFGFFDTTNGVHETSNNAIIKDQFTEGVLDVPAGDSWSAYVFGKSEFLKNKGLNQGTSIYPDQIGYNVRNYDVEEFIYHGSQSNEQPGFSQTYKRDVLDNKHTFCYGQVEKTPEWASRITGIPEETIKELAKMFVTKKVTVWTGSGFQRCTESEEIVRSWICFNTLVRNYGQQGASFGSVGFKSGGKGDGGLAALIPGARTKTFNDENKGSAYIRKDEKGIYTDPTKGGYNKGDIANHIDNTIKARVDANFCTIDPTSSNLISDYGMYGYSTKTPNLTPCFTWMENVEASLKTPVSATKTLWTGTKFEKKGVQIRPARWNTGSNQTVSTPVGMITQMASNQLAVTTGNSNYHVELYKNAGIEFIVTCDNVMTPSCRYADLILPGSMGFERYTISGNSWGGGRNYVFTGKAINPPGDAKCELEIGLEIAKATNQETEYRSGIQGESDGSFEEAFWKASYDATPAKDQNGNTISWEKAKKGYYVKKKDPAKNEGYDNNAEFTNSMGTAYDENGVNTAYKNYYLDPAQNYLPTYTGRVEAYSLRYVEDYESRFFNNEDDTTYTNLYTLADDGVTAVSGTSGKISLNNSGKIYTKSTAALNNNGEVPADNPATYASSKPRYVYPVPMYIPLVEGRHADNSHPVDQKVYNVAHEAQDLDLTLHTWHIMYRAHSTHNSSGLINEVKYYKRDYKGEPTYFTKDLVDGANGATDYTAINDYTKGAYETCWINPATAVAKDISENDLVVIENERGAIVASAHLSHRVSPGAVYIGHGSWYNPVTEWTSPTGKKYQNIDVGGCANTLTNTRPSRMCQGMTLANDCRVKISKA